MALVTEVGTLQSPTTTGSQLVNLTNFTGVTPQAIIIWTVAQTADGASVDALMGMGMATSSSNRGSWAINLDDQTALGDEDRRYDDTKVVILLGPTGSLLEAADLTSFGSNQFTLNWTTADSTQFRYHYLVLGGSDITGATVVKGTKPTSNGAENVAHGLAAVPTAILTTSAHVNAAIASGTNEGNTEISASLGGSDATNNVWGGVYASNLAGSATRALTSTHMISHAQPAAIVETGAVTAVDATNITITWAGTNTAEIYYMLVLVGPTCEVGTFTSPTSNGDTTVSTAIEPECVVTWGVMNTTSASIQTDCRFMVGMSDGTNHVSGGILVRETDGHSDRFSDDAASSLVYNHTPTLLESSSAAISGSDITFSFSPTQAQANEYGYFALGPGDGGGGEPPSEDPQLPGLPGVDPETQTGAADLCWGGDAGKGLCVFKSAIIDESARDARQTDTRELKTGLILGKITATGKYSNYDPDATDGTQIAECILLGELNIDNLEGSDVDRVFAVLCKGPIKVDRLYPLDDQARRSLAHRFIWDDDLTNRQSFLGLPAGHVQVTGDATLTDVHDGKRVVCSENDCSITLPELSTHPGFAVTVLMAADQELVVSSSEQENMIMGNTTTASSITFTTAGEQIGVQVTFEAIRIEGVGKWLVTYHEPPKGTDLGTITYAIDGGTTAAQTLWNWDAGDITQADWNTFIGTLPASSVVPSQKQGSNSLSEEFDAVNGYRMMVPIRYQVPTMEADGRFNMSREIANDNGDKHNYVAARKVSPHAAPQFVSGQYLVPARRYRETLVFNMETNGFSAADWAALGPNDWVQVWERWIQPPSGWTGTVEAPIALYCYNDQWRMQVMGALGTALHYTDGVTNAPQSVADPILWTFTGTSNPHTFVIEWFSNWHSSTGIGPNGFCRVTHNGTERVNVTQAIGTHYGGASEKGALLGAAGIYSNRQLSNGPALHLHSWKIEEF